jgi:hypothetical protein
MRFERERDIPAFKGKNWRERIALRNLAKQRDPSIIWRRTLIFFSAAVSILVLSQFFPHRPFAAFVYVVLLHSILTLLDAVFITPKIRKALESDAIPSA